MRAIPVVLLGLLLACNGGPGPEPTPPPPTPTPCPDLGVPWCHETDPPMHCGECKHQPPEEDCPVKAPPCEPTPPPNLPEPQCQTFTNRAGVLDIVGDDCDCYMGEVWQPCPEPECGFPQGIPNSKFTGTTNPGTFGSVVNATMAELTGCNVGSDCPITFGPDPWMALVCEKLCEKGFNCGRHKDTPPGATDQISVIQGSFCDGRAHENYQIYNYGGQKVRWAPGGKQDGWYVDCGGITPTPTPPPTPSPTPPPGSACGDPHPETCERTQFSLKKHHQNWDSTYQCTRSCDYCEAIGMGEHGGVIRCGCPVRPECGQDAPPDAICHEREACERDMIGDQKWWCDGQPIEPLPHNSAQAHCTGHVKTCTEDGRTCAEADW